MTQVRPLWGKARNSFSKGPHQKSWVLAGAIVSKQVPTPRSPSPAVQFTKLLHPQLFGEVQGETLDKLCLPHIAFLALHLDMTLVTQNADRPENISVYTKLTQANPRSVGPGCSGISSTSCAMARATAIH